VGLHSVVGGKDKDKTWKLVGLLMVVG